MNQKKSDNENKNSDLRISLRQTTAYSAVALLLLGVTFFGGYFFGKKHMVEQFVMKIEQDSFADQIYSSLCTLYEPEELLPEEPVVMKAIAADLAHEAPKEEILVTEACGDTDVESTPSYYAELIGYGTRKAAESFVQKMTSKSIPVKLKTRKSATAQGKNREWYQVVTGLYENRENLERVTDRLAREEKINGIRIITSNMA